MIDSSKFKESNESYGFLFWQTYTLWSRKIKKGLKPYKLTHTQFVILSVIGYLKKSRSSISQVDVSNLSKIDVMTISTSLKTLIKNGLVTSTHSKSDSRANTLNLTQQGQDTLNKAIQVVEKIDEEFFQQSGINLEKFLDMLKTVNRANES